MTTKINTALSKPSAFIWILGLYPLMEYRKAQGTARAIRMSNTLEPKTLLMAMSAFPWRATTRLQNRSGTLVPAAQNVRPIAVLLMPMSLPAFMAHSIMKSTSNPIQRIDVVRQRTRPTLMHFFHVGEVQSGMVSMHRTFTATSGSDRTHVTELKNVQTGGNAIIGSCSWPSGLSSTAPTVASTFMYGSRLPWIASPVSGASSRPSGAAPAGDWPWLGPSST
mmetsp:Transcript_106071/g.300083  ORF Transcript_106071/g.300083 Transcript_106071/m.300083 type:complete len:222 (+) Transcript_106071:314-979(+)